MFYESTGVCTEEAKSCKTLYPYLIPVSQLPGFYDFESQGEAASAREERVGSPVIPRKASPAASGPCPVGKQYDPGWHARLPVPKCRRVCRSGRWMRLYVTTAAAMLLPSTALGRDH